MLITCKFGSIVIKEKTRHLMQAISPPYQFLNYSNIFGALFVCVKVAKKEEWKTQLKLAFVSTTWGQLHQAFYAILYLSRAVSLSILSTHVLSNHYVIM